jgi:hypothetical protein
MIRADCLACWIIVTLFPLTVSYLPMGAGQTRVPTTCDYMRQVRRGFVLPRAFTNSMRQASLA